MEVRTESISFASQGRLVGAHVAVPASGRGPGVLVVHEASGLGEFARGVCERLAREGFVGLAPDLFDGRVAESAERARELLAGLDPERACADLEAAVHALLSHDAVDGPRVGALGFCMGGHFALAAACRSARVGAVVDFYGLLEAPPLELAALRAPLLAVFAERDEFVRADSVERLRSELRAAGKRAAVVLQRGARHGFMNEMLPDRFDAAAAAECWDRLLAFLRAELA